MNNGTKIVIERKKLISKVGEEAAVALIKECQETAIATINISFDAIGHVLSAGKCKSCWETRTRNFDDYKKNRHSVEYSMGIRSKGTQKDPHPIYGAIATNHRDQLQKGAASEYGSCFFILKKERIQERTMVCYGDSFRRKDMSAEQHDALRFTFDDVAVAKAMLEGVDEESEYQFVEIQVLGGVSLEDIEFVCITGGQTSEVLDQVEKWRKQFPNIRFIFT